MSNARDLDATAAGKLKPEDVSMICGHCKRKTFKLRGLNLPNGFIQLKETECLHCGEIARWNTPPAK